MDASVLDGVDSGGMYRVYDRWPELAREQLDSGGGGMDLGGGVSHVVFAGMGGSGAIGDIFAAILSKTGTHVEVVKGYVLPRTAGPGSLVVATSISGNTEETLSVLAGAADAGCRTVAFSDGGRMEEYCGRRGIRHRRIPMVHSPRTSFPAYLFSILGALGPFLPIEGAHVEEAVAAMEGLRGEISSANLGRSNPALELARWMPAVPMIYYPWGLQAAAIRFKNSLQENAKMHAMTEDIVEACHNGIVSWEAESASRPVLLRGADDYYKTKERWGIIRGFFESRGIEYREVGSVGGSILSKLINLIYLLDYSSIYRAVLSGVDPTPVAPIDFVKERLGGGPAGGAPP